MNGKLKALTLAIVAMFCLTAAICVIDDKDSSAADSVEHYLYFEIVSDDGLVTSSDWIKFTSTTDATDFVTEANKAFAYYGYTNIKFIDKGTYLSITYDTKGVSSCFVGSDDGKSWVKVDDTKGQYPNAKYIGLALNNGYISKEVYDKLDDDQKKNWSETTMSGNYAYVKSTIEAKTTDADTHKFPEEYTSHVFVEIIGADGKDTSTKWVEFKSLKTLASFVSNANTTFANNGLSKLTFSSSGWVTYDGSFSNATYYAKDKEWVAVGSDPNDYTNEVIALAVGNGYISTDVYKALSDSEKESWKSTGSSGTDYDYMKVVTESTTGYESSSSNNTGLIVGIVVVVIVVIAAASFVFLKKK